MISIFMPVFGAAGYIVAFSEGFEGLFVMLLAAIMGIVIAVISLKIGEIKVFLTYIGLFLNIWVAIASGLGLCGF